jgi:hypothetical protein
MKTISALCLSVACMLIMSCKDEEPQPQSTPSGMHYSYAPTNIGHEAVYEVTSITKDEFTGNEDTLQYELKEVIESVFTDIAGRQTQRLERYTRNSPSDPWVISDVWTSNLLPDRLERNEENTPYVKLRFPINEGGTWNGNLLNGLTAQDYTYGNINTPLLLNGISFDSTLTVTQIDSEDLLEKNYAVERYATGAGLVYRESIYIKKDFNNPGNIKAQNKYRQTIVSFTN